MKKRSHGEGSLFRRGEKWRAQVTADGERPSFTSKEKGAAGKREAREWLKQMTKEIEYGLSYSATQTDLSTFLDLWMDAIEKSVRERTYLNNRSRITVQIKPYIGHLKMKEIKPVVIQKLYSRLREDGHSEYIVESVHKVLNQSFKWGIKLGYLGSNPCDRITPPRPEKEEMKIWDEEEVNRFLLACQGHRLEALFHVALTTGMRAREMYGLQWDDIDWDKRTVFVQRQLYWWRYGKITYKPPKTAFGIRRIKLSNNTVKMLSKHWEYQQLEKEALRERRKDFNLIFTSTVGTPLEHGNVLRNDYDPLVEAAEVTRIRFHDMRHTAASLMLNHGVPLLVVSRILGHSNPTITLNTYGHLIPNSMDMAADLMDSLMPIEVPEISDIGNR